MLTALDEEKELCVCVLGGWGGGRVLLNPAWRGRESSSLCLAEEGKLFYICPVAGTVWAQASLCMQVVE